MPRARTALVHAGGIALLLGCCGLSALVMSRFAVLSLELIYSSWGGPRLVLAKGDPLRDGRFWTD